MQEARNAMKGRGFDINRIPDHASNYMLSLMGTSKFGAEQFKDLRFKDVTVGMASPAILSVFDFAEDTAKILDELMLEGYDWSELDKKNFKRFPGLGDMYYNFFGGGHRRLFRKRRQKQRLKLRNAPLAHLGEGFFLNLVLNQEVAEVFDLAQVFYPALVSPSRDVLDDSPLTELHLIREDVFNRLNL